MMREFELILENQATIMLALAALHPDRETAFLLREAAEQTTVAISELRGGGVPEDWRFGRITT